jgi:hypothetical protein
MGYFGIRAAPLGPVPAEVVTAVFYNFHPSRVARAVPEVWSIASPERMLEVRLAAVDAGLRRMLGDAVLAGPEVAEAAELARAAAEAAPVAGRSLGAANLALDWPAEPHLVLWHATTVLRESRGDGHIAALLAAGLDPCEALITLGADRGVASAYLKVARGWSDAEWDEAVGRLTERGLWNADEDGLTKRGTALRAWIEERTDDAAAGPWDALGAAATARLAELLDPMALTLARQNEAMRVNPLGLDAEAELTATRR